MDIRNKKLLLIGAIILLLVINITALGTFLYNNNIKHKRYNEMRQVQKHIEKSGMHQFIKEELKLNDSQFEKFQELSKVSFEKSHEIVYKLEEKRIELFDALTKDVIDEKQLDRIAKEIGELHYELKKETINHFLELKDVCSNEQQDALEKLFMQMLQKEDHGPMNPKERKHRNREGKQNENFD